MSGAKIMAMAISINFGVLLPRRAASDFTAKRANMG
jgi:hypothetical protein